MNTQINTLMPELHNVAMAYIYAKYDQSKLALDRFRLKKVTNIALMPVMNAQELMDAIEDGYEVVLQLTETESRTHFPTLDAFEGLSRTAYYNLYLSKNQDNFWTIIHDLANIWIEQNLDKITATESLDSVDSDLFV